MSALSVEAMQASIAQYKKQYDEMTAQLATLETNYRQQKALGEQTLHMLSGAIAAVEQILQNVEAETQKADASVENQPQG